MSEAARVWAPRAGRVELDLPGQQRREPMRPDTTGWWMSEPLLVDATDYAFCLDGGPPRPDPRSPWQPAGVHAHSRHYDPAGFTWSDHDWQGLDARGAVLYEMHIGTFTH